MKEAIVYHKSKDGKYLVEVKRYRYFSYVTRWVYTHPSAQVFVKVQATGLPPVWWEISAKRHIRLASKDIERLPEVLWRE